MSIPGHNRHYSLILILLTILCSSLQPASAEVVRIEIESRTPFAGGAQFGEAGAYELLKGTLHFAVDPDLAANSRITDLRYAPRNGDRRVEFVSEFELLDDACDRLVQQRLLRPESAGEYLALARTMAWPPEPGGEYPYWKLSTD